METKNQMIDHLSQTDNPKIMGFHLAGDDGQGNQYWVRGQIRLNRYEDGDGSVFWDDDVSGWEINF